VNLRLESFEVLTTNTNYGLGDQLNMARILVVDDNAEIQMLLVALLQRAGHDVIEAADGVHVEKEIHDTDPDLVMLDLMMPILDGWSMTCPR
jgi:OmpR family response regulator RpaB